MRQIDPKLAEERKQKVLQSVIHKFIKTGKPVGSNILTEDYKFGLSPASIRNMMSELEDEGYLTHPHTSAGRIPTDKGYRKYVDSLIEMQKLIIDEEDRVRNEYEEKTRELQGLLSQTSKILSGLSHFTGFVLTPKMDRSTISYIELINLGDHRVLVILVTDTGMVKHKMLEAHVPDEKLFELNRVLNIKLRGMGMLQAKKKIVDAIEEAEREHLEILQLANTLSSSIFNLEEELYMEGSSNVLNLPEFHDYEPMRSLIRLNEDRNIFMRVLEHDMDIDKDGVNVLIGKETSCVELKDMSVVSSVYKEDGRSVGILGIIGPKRMEYPKMMALVGAVSKIVSKILTKVGG